MAASPIKDHEAAKRLARAIASDLSLYNETKVKQGIEGDSFFELMAKEIEEGRQHYNSKVDTTIRDQTNYFDRALVDVILKRKGHIKSKIWRGDAMIPLITAPILSGIPGVKHAFTTREGGVSEGLYAALNMGRDTGDDDDRVDQNYERLAELIGTSKEKLIGAHQVHGADVLKVEGGEKSEDYWGTDADAFMTNNRDLYLTVRVADCLPILLLDSDRRAVAVVHAGWRGTLAGVLPATISEMRKEYQTDPAKLKVAIGPGIGICCYEISFGVAALLRSEHGLEANEATEKESGVYVSLAQINARLAREAGVPAANVWNAGFCTRCDAKRFFSYRRDGKKSGRSIGFIGIAA